MFVVGGTECLKDVGHQLWHQAMVEESQPPPSFYSRSFKANAENLLDEKFGLLHDEITPETWKLVYLNVIHNMSI